MEERKFSTTEIVQVLRDSKSIGDRRAESHLITQDEAKGWSLGMMNVAKRLGVEEQYKTPVVFFDDPKPSPTEEEKRHTDPEAQDDVDPEPEPEGDLEVGKVIFTPLVEGE